MATGKITKSTVSDIQPGPKDKLLWDSKLPGFGLKVTPKGAKVFLYQYRIGGRDAKVRRYTIGRFGAFTPEAARTEAERLSRIVAQGGDPQTQKQDRQRQVVDLAFNRYLPSFVDECLKKSWQASHEEAEAMLKRYAIPVLKAKPLPDINRADIKAVIKKLDGKQAMASKLFAVMRRLFKWAISEGDLTVSPMDGMEPPPVPKSRDRVLEDEELAVAWQASYALGYPFGPMARLLILSGARREEVAGLEWSELSQAKALWSLPAARSKNDEGTSIPLSPLAMEEINALAGRIGKEKKWPRRGLIFSTTGKTHSTGYSRAKTRMDKEIADILKKREDRLVIEPWRFHDLRRTVATGLQKLGTRFEVTEAILNHKSGSRSGVAAVYQRHNWAPEKRTALDAWAAHITGITSGIDVTNVVPLTKVS